MEVKPLRKKKIIEQNANLFKQIESLQGKIKELTEKNHDLEAQINALRENKAEKTEAPADTPIEAVKEKVLTANFSAEEYGAKAIGKVVVSATKATSLLSGAAGAEKVEVVNLILGRAEVAKADILNAASSDASDNEKKIAIDSIVEKTCDYFNKTINNIT